MDVTTPSLSAADAIVDMWLALAASQRAHGSHLLVLENRARIRESIYHHITTDRLLVARGEVIYGFIMFRREIGVYEQDIERGIVERRSHGVLQITYP